MLEKEAQNGNTCFPKNALFDNTIDEMKKAINGPIKREILESTLDKLIEKRKIKLLQVKNQEATE